MIIEIGYDKVTNSAVLFAKEKDDWHWDAILKNIYDSVPLVRQYQDSVYISIEMFISIMGSIANYTRSHGIRVIVQDSLRPLLTNISTRSYSAAIASPHLSHDEILAQLSLAGFVRKPTENQLNNLSKIGRMPSAATFSVPGAGKTTEALAFFYLNARPEDKLLVVAPKNAFGSWDEQIADCLGDKSLSFVRLRGGEERIDLLLRSNPRFSIITYQQYPRVSDTIARFLQRNSVFMFLDESHRIKSGKSGISADSILRASYLPQRKLVMSGTPMPQSIKDLIPQFSFLYPDKNVNEINVMSLVDNIYVRTNSLQLGIPPVVRRRRLLKMSPLQSKIYEVIKSETKRQLIPLLSDMSKVSLREINKKIMKVMQFVSNPALLAKDVDYIFDPALGELLTKETGPKIDYACKRARELAAEGKKVLIWSQFVENVELIAERLKDLGADFIHGGVDAGDEDDNDTREGKIKAFHQDPHKMVLVANPAAASEGISLHKVCQYALYVDRSFNAAHYLQSEDRIHRLGLRPDQTPIVEIIECEGTIDQVIATRLESKISVMSNALQDSSLQIDTLDYDADYDPEEISFTADDIEAIRRYFIDIVI